MRGGGRAALPMASAQGVQAGQAGAQLLRADAEVDQGDDLVGAGVGHRLGDRQGGVHVADQGPLVAVAAVGPAEDHVQVVLAERLEVGGEAETVGDAAEQGQGGAHVTGHRFEGVGAGALVVGAEIGVQQDGDPPGVRVEAVAAPGPAVAGDVLPELVDVLGHQVGHDAQVVLGGPLIGLRVRHDRRVERWHGLYGTGEEADVALPVAGGAAQRLTAPEAFDLLQPVVHLLLVLPEALGEEDEVVGVPAAGHAETDASAGEVVRHGPLLRHPDRVVQRHDDRTGVQADAPGFPGQGGGQHGGVGEETAEGVEVPLGHPQRLEAALVGEPGGLHEEFVAPLLRPGALLRIVAEEVEAEVGAP
ncbi:hypothetical protein GA0115255_102532 [Streptomyces sp. Ncost-T6T-2b]|nr:hypothetical protein GA0115255_102532 [Streptomyces sp. Ncost-T6T-2b]